MLLEWLNFKIAIFSAIYFPLVFWLQKKHKQEIISIVDKTLNKHIKDIDKREDKVRRHLTSLHYKVASIDENMKRELKLINEKLDEAKQQRK